jgi:hypothetical protein
MAIIYIFVSLKFRVHLRTLTRATTYRNEADLGADRRNKRCWCEVVQEVNRGQMCWNVAFFLCQQGRGVAYDRNKYKSA